MPETAFAVRCCSALAQISIADATKVSNLNTSLQHPDEAKYALVWRAASEPVWHSDFLVRLPGRFALQSRFRTPRRGVSARDYQLREPGPAAIELAADRLVLDRG